MKKRRMIKPEKQLDPYRQPMTDAEWYESVGLPIEEAKKIAAGAGVPFTVDEADEQVEKP